MKIPQYSIKTLLKLTAACAVPALIAARAYQGAEWAKGIVMGAVGVVVALGAVFTMYVAMYAVAYGLSRVFAGRTRELEVARVDELGRLPPTRPPLPGE